MKLRVHVRCAQGCVSPASSPGEQAHLPIELLPRQARVGVWARDWMAPGACRPNWLDERKEAGEAGERQGTTALGKGARAGSAARREGQECGAIRLQQGSFSAYDVPGCSGCPNTAVTPSSAPPWWRTPASTATAHPIRMSQPTGVLRRQDHNALTYGIVVTVTIL